jgi:hypothetical protein
MDVDFKNPNGQTILNYTNYAKGGSSFGRSFNYTAVDRGDYSLWIWCGGNLFFQDAKYPEMTIEFEVLEAVPTRIDVLSPLNQTYYESRLFLHFAANKPLSWVGYSLDGKDNVTINSNTTLTELSDGMHKITVYANNTYGNVVVTETVFFTVETFSNRICCCFSGWSGCCDWCRSFYLLQETQTFENDRQNRIEDNSIFFKSNFSMVIISY